MKKTTYTFNIPNPCPEKWNKMEERPDGRHCQRCEKTVVDFSDKSDREVVAYFKKMSGNVCGRFRSDQVGRPHHFYSKEKNIGRIQALGLLLSGLLFGADVKGDTTSVKVPFSLEIAESVFTIGFFTTRPQKKLTGKIVDENGDPVTGVRVMANGPVVGTCSDANGLFEINAQSCNTLELWCSGYANKEINITYPYSGQLEIVMKKDDSMLWNYLVGDIIYIPVPDTMSIIKRKIIDFFKHIKPDKKKKDKNYPDNQLLGLEKTDTTFPEEDQPTEPKTEKPFLVQLYPNPFSFYINLELNCPENENLIIQLLDLQGRIVFSKKQRVEAGANTILFSPDLQGVAAGHYILQATGRGGIYFAEMIAFTGS
ncbi:MAG: carboxypeptidase-like regulatory domain-containing protein [Bacteroidota bacterium]